MNTRSEDLGRPLSENERWYLSKMIVFLFQLRLIKAETHWNAEDILSNAAGLSEWIEDINGDFYEYPRDDY